MSSSEPKEREALLPTRGRLARVCVLLVYSSYFPADTASQASDEGEEEEVEQEVMAEQRRG